MDRWFEFERLHPAAASAVLALLVVMPFVGALAIAVATRTAGL